MDKIEKVMRVSLEGRTANNLMFILSDVIETLSLVAKREFAKEEMIMTSHANELVKHFNQKTKEGKVLRKKIKKFELEDNMSNVNDVVSLNKMRMRLDVIEKHIAFISSDIRKEVRNLQMDSQETFGEDSDKILELILQAIDKTGDDNLVMDNIIFKTSERKSKLNLNMKKFGL